MAPINERYIIMKYGLFDILKGTPLWVWAVFIYLLIMGFQASKKRTILIARLPISPCIFIVWSLSSMHSKYGLNSLSLSLWLITCILGILLGFYVLQKETITINRENSSVQLSGSYIPLILAISFFAIKYIIGATYALQPAFKINPLFFGTDIVVSGVISGVSWGRLIKIMKKFLIDF